MAVTWFGRTVLMAVLMLVLVGMATAQDDQAAAVQRAVTALASADPEQQRTAQQELIRIGAPAVEALMAAVTDRAYAGRLRALRTLGTIRDPRAVPTLVEAARDPSAGVRRAALAALGAINDAQAIAPLLAAMHDADPWMREAAIRALGAYRDPRILPALIDYLQAGDPEAFAHSLAEGSGAPKTMNAVVEALVQIGTPATEPLLTVLKGKSTEGRLCAAVALGKLKEPRAVEPILASLQAWKPIDMETVIPADQPPEAEPERTRWGKNIQQRMRNAVLNNIAIDAYLAALADLNDRRAIAPLIVLLQNADPGARRKTARTLKQMTGQQFGEDAAQWQAWWKQQGQ